MLLIEKIKKILVSFGIKVDIDVIDYNFDEDIAKYGVKLLDEYNYIDV